MTHPSDQPPWMAHAACRNIPTDVFYPDVTGSGHDQAAKRICAGCPVGSECLTWALVHYERHGIWGGLNEVQRKAEARRRRRQRTA